MPGKITDISFDFVQNSLKAISSQLGSVQEKILNLSGTDKKIYTLIVLGSVLQSAALASLTALIAFSFIATAPASLVGTVIATVSAIFFGFFGIMFITHPQAVNDWFQSFGSFVPGQPIGLTNERNDCWINSSLQLLANVPGYQERLRQIPFFTEFFDNYAAAERNQKKVAPNINTHAFRQFLNGETSGEVDQGHLQADAAQVFEYLFGGPNALYSFEQQRNGEVSPNATSPREPMIQIHLGLQQNRSNFQQLFHHYFDHYSDIGENIQLFFRQAPNDLLIQMVRFYQFRAPDGTFQQGKINDLIDIPERIAVPQQFIKTNESAQYACDAFLIHRGQVADGGHFFAYIKKSGVWWYCSDTRVYTVSADQALNDMKNGYIFHFAKVTASPSTP